MNILFLIRSIGKGIGGVEVVTINLANELIAKGHQISIFVFTKGNAEVLDRLNKNIKLYVGNGYKNSNENSDYLREIFIRHNVDIVVNQWGLPYLPIKVINRARRGMNIKVISVYHNDPITNGRLKNIENALSKTSNLLKCFCLKIKWHIWKSITSHSMRYVYNHSDRYMVLSPSHVEHFESFTNMQDTTKLIIQTNPVTIDSSTYIFDTSNKQKEILYVGRIDYNQKRVYRVIDTWALLENKYPDWKLTIVGDGCERKNLEIKTEKMGLKRVSFEGLKNPLEYYKRASILLLTSEYEGFGLVIVEAMSFGVVPIVYGSYSAVYDIIENGKDGIILPYSKEGYNAQSVIPNIVSIMEDENKYYKIALSALEKSNQFSIENIANSWERILAQLISEEN